MSPLEVAVLPSAKDLAYEAFNDASWEKLRLAWLELAGVRFVGSRPGGGWAWCRACLTMTIVCPRCGNNACNGGRGCLRDGSPCDVCPQVYVEQRDAWSSGNWHRRETPRHECPCLSAPLRTVLDEEEFLSSLIEMSARPARDVRSVYQLQVSGSSAVFAGTKTIWSRRVYARPPCGDLVESFKETCTRAADGRIDWIEPGSASVKILEYELVDNDEERRDREVGR